MNGLASKRSRRAFTLVELLVVVAIIAVLAAVVFSVMPGIMVRVRTVGCLSNLRALGLGYHAFLADNGGVIPPPDSSASTMWASKIIPYVPGKDDGKFTDVFRCPEVRKGRKLGAVGANWGTIDYVNYPLGFTRLLQIDNPAQVPMISDDALEVGGYDGVANINWFWNNYMRRPLNENSAKVHPLSPNGAINVCFYDGHVQTVKNPRLVWENDRYKLLSD
jgi:prepilin-type N-terminal cleavage/methylation domain-containing protein/prepilin-type processing-associated H-X9-DG protein